MLQNIKLNPRAFIKTILWVLLAQLILLHVSAALYAYKFTHLNDGPVPEYTRTNVFVKTWKLFTGPAIYKMPYTGSPSFPYEEVILNMPGNIAINGWYSGREKAKGCVVFFHGLTGNKTLMFQEAVRFREWGYNIMLIDLRGHGKSSGHITSFGARETEEVKEAFDFVLSKGNRTVILYGSSMGAAAVLKAAAENKVHPAALIADMPFASLHDHLKARARVLGFPAEPFALLVTFWLGVERGYNGFDHDVCAYAKKVKCPVLLQWGEKDPFVTREETDTIYKSLGVSNKKQVVYSEAGHQSFQAIDPLGWEKEVGQFIRLVNP